MQEYCSALGSDDHPASLSLTRVAHLDLIFKFEIFMRGSYVETLRLAIQNMFWSSNFHVKRSSGTASVLAAVVYSLLAIDLDQRIGISCPSSYPFDRQSYLRCSELCPKWFHSLQQYSSLNEYVHGSILSFQGLHLEFLLESQHLSLT